jgi:hypothetical protein
VERVTLHCCTYDWIKLGQSVLPPIEFADGPSYREQSDHLAARVKAGTRSEV